MGKKIGVLVRVGVWDGGGIVILAVMVGKEVRVAARVCVGRTGVAVECTAGEMNEILDGVVCELSSEHPNSIAAAMSKVRKSRVFMGSPLHFLISVWQSC